MNLDPQVAFLMQLGAANQEVAQEKRNNMEVSQADFLGVAQANWKKMSDDGAGIVEYKGKVYYTMPQGTKSIPEGTKVSLEYRKGFYITYW